MPPTPAERGEAGRWEKTPVAVRCDVPSCDRLIVAGARMLVFERHRKAVCRDCAYGDLWEKTRGGLV